MNRILPRLACMATLLCALVSAFSAHAAATIDARSTVRISKEILESTVRIKVETDVGTHLVAGHGSAFGVDLSGYGIYRPRYLLTAAHMVMAEDGSGFINGRVSVELDRSHAKRWVHCRILSVTRVYDLCLLECDEDVPVISKLTPGKPGLDVGAPLLVVGCPLGVPPQVSAGFLRDKDPQVNDRSHRVWEATAAFNHGNSGGPVFCAANGGVVGVAIAGVREKHGGPQDMDPSIGLFTPYYCVKHFWM